MKLKTNIKKNSTLIVSTIKTEQANWSARLDWEIRPIAELLSNVFLIDIHILSNQNIEQIIIHNPNRTRLCENDVAKHLSSINSLEVYNHMLLLERIKIFNSNPFLFEENIAEFISTYKKEEPIYIVQDLLDLQLVFALIKSKQSVIIANVDGVLNSSQSLSKIRERILDNNPPLEIKDGREYYKQFLIDQIDSNYLNEIDDFIENQPHGKLYYFYSEEKQLLESAIQKIRICLKFKHYKYHEDYDYKNSDVTISDYNIVYFSKTVNLDGYSSKIAKHINANKTFLIFHLSSEPKIEATTSYLPNIKEVENELIHIFLYLLLPYVYSVNLQNELLSLVKENELAIELAKFDSLESLSNWIGEINVSSLDGFKKEGLVKELIERINKSIIIYNSIRSKNQIKFSGNKFEIEFKGNSYELSNTIGPRLVVFLLGNKTKQSITSMSKTIRKTTVDPRIDYDSLTKPYYHLIKEIKQIEKDKNINLNKFSEYLSQNFKASKKAGFEFISINTSGLDWKIENFDKIFPKK